MKGFITSKCKTDDPAHTRMAQCSLFEAAPIGFIIHNKDYSFPSDSAGFNTEIENSMVSVGLKRAVPVLNGLVDYTPSGGDAKSSQEGFGPEVINGINPKKGKYTFDKGGICLFKQMSKMNGQEVRIFNVDKNKVAYGTVATIENEEVFRGFLATIFTERRENDGKATGGVIVTINYSEKYEEEQQAMASFQIDGELEGLTGIILQKTGGAGHAKVVVACSGDDLTRSLSDILDDPEIYADTMGKSPAGVSYNTATEDITITPTGSYKIRDAEVLSSKDIDGYEGENIYTDLA